MSTQQRTSRDLSSEGRLRSAPALPTGPSLSRVSPQRHAQPIAENPAPPPSAQRVAVFFPPGAYHPYPLLVLPPAGGALTMTRLLDGIRVIDAANFIAGPVSTTIMADFGADVIKVEPPTGDVYRVRGAGYPPSPYNYPWIVDNRTKRSVAIDLRTGDGQDLLHRLVRDADVFVTNAPHDSRARLRVRYEDLAPLNTRLVYASISAYGETGEEASKPGFDSIALWARTGLMDLVRASPDVPPARSLPGMGDHPTGTSLFAAIMAVSTIASVPGSAPWWPRRCWPTGSG